MKIQDIQKKYNKQKKLLLKYNHHYFNLDSPLVTDSKYDKIKNEIIKLENDFPKLKKKVRFQSKSVLHYQKKLKKLNIPFQCFLFPTLLTKKV